MVGKKCEKGENAGNCRQHFGKWRKSWLGRGLLKTFWEKENMLVFSCLPNNKILDWSKLKALQKTK